VATAVKEDAFPGSRFGRGKSTLSPRVGTQPIFYVGIQKSVSLPYLLDLEERLAREGKIYNFNYLMDLMISGGAFHTYDLISMRSL